MTIVTQDAHAIVFNYDIIDMEKGKTTNIGIYALKMPGNMDTCLTEYKLAEYATPAEASKVMDELKEAVIAGKQLFVMPSY